MEIVAVPKELVGRLREIVGEPKELVDVAGKVVESKTQHQCILVRDEDERDVLIQKLLFVFNRCKPYFFFKQP